MDVELQKPDIRNMLLAKPDQTLNFPSIKYFFFLYFVMLSIFVEDWGTGSQIKALVKKESRIQSSNQMLPVKRGSTVFDNTLTGVCVDNCKNAIQDK